MDRPTWYPNERVDIADLRAATGALVLAELERWQRVLTLPAGRSTTGQAATSARVLSGFTRTIVGNVFTLAAGAGIFARNDSGALSFGLLGGDQAPASYALTLGSDGVHAIWVRMVETPSATENRVFWDATGATEVVESVTTRTVATWEAVSRLASAGPPGLGEYAKLWEATVAGGVITASADFRHFFFEGSAHPSDAYEHEWGSGNDRNADRATYGVQDLHRFVSMVRRQLSDIVDPVGGQAAHKAVTVGLHQLDDEHLTSGQHGAVHAVSLAASVSVTSPQVVVQPGVGTTGLIVDPYALAMTGTAVAELRYARRDPASAATVPYAAMDCFGFEERGRGDFYSDFRSSDEGAFATLADMAAATWPWGNISAAGAPTAYGNAATTGGVTRGLGLYVPADADSVTITPGMEDGSGALGDLPAMELLFSALGAEWTRARLALTLKIGAAMRLYFECKNYAGGAGPGFWMQFDDGGGPGGVGLAGSPVPAGSMIYSVRLVVTSPTKYWFDVRSLSTAPASTPVSLGSQTYDVSGLPVPPADTDPLGVTITVENQSGGAGTSMIILHRFQYRSRRLLMLPV